MRAGIGRKLQLREGRRTWRLAASMASTLAILTAGAALTLLIGSHAGSPRAASVRAAARSNTPAGVVLALWREIGARNYTAAYAKLDRRVAASLRYASFRRRARATRRVFLRDPRIVRVVSAGALGTVSVASARDGVWRPDSPIVVFRVRQQRGIWRIATSAGL